MVLLAHVQKSQPQKKVDQIMVVQVIKVLPELDNIESLDFPSDHEWSIDVEVSGLGEIKESVLISRQNEVEVPSSRGTANLVFKVDKNHHATISVVDIPKVTKSTIQREDADSGKYTAVIGFDCRGCEVKAWIPTGFYKARTPSGFEFDEVDLASGEWYDVEPESNLPVGILSVKYKIETFRK